MRRFLLVLLVCHLSLFMSAQFGGFGNAGPKIKGKITGIIIDSLSTQPVGFASLSLKKMGSEKIINGTLSEDDGKFTFTDIKPGKYNIDISFLGFTDKSIIEVVTTKKNPDTNIGQINLTPDNILLDEVQITEKRALFENKVDRIVFNAEDDSSVAGGDATDVLRKVPNLSVDLDGNVSIRGSQNIRILINGKPSGMFSSNVSEALKMFPADQIKKVEVITSPGAKYDAEGSGGIINIVTKKSEIEGVAGSFNLSGGNRQQSGFVNLNAGKGRFGSSLNGSVFYSVPQDGGFTFERTDNTSAGERSYIQDGTSRTSRLGFGGTASAFYDINAYNALNTSFNLRGYGFDTDSDISSVLTSPMSNQSFNVRRNQIDDNITDVFDWNTDYTRKFESNETQELVLAYQLSRNNQDQDINIGEFDSFDMRFRDEIQFNDSDNYEHTGQVDYTHPASKKVTIETGIKTVIRDINSNFQYSNREFPFTSDYFIDPSRSNNFDYNQNVIAGYGQVKFPIGKFLLISGLRYERTDISGSLENNEDAFENSYDNFIPNFTISRPLPKFRNLKLSYSKRIQRPSLTFINPFVNASDQFNIRLGNPELAPELTHQIEVGYNTSIAGFNIFGSGYYKITNDIIEQILSITEQGISINTYDNVGQNNSIGINMFVNKTINKLSIRFGGDIFTYNGEGVVNGEELTNNALQYQIFTNGEYKISGTWKADFFGFFRSNQATLQGSTPSFSIFGMGLRKDLKDWSIGIRVIEPFSENKSFNSDQKGENLRQISSFSLPFRSFGLNLRYKFGKVDFKERKSKIRNTDQKSGGDGQGGQQGGSNSRG